MVLHMVDALRVAAIFSESPETNIPLENILAMNYPEVERWIVVLDKMPVPMRAYDSSTQTPRVQWRWLGGFSALSLFKMIATLKEVKPDIVHVHHTVSGLIALMASRILGHQKFIVTIHNDYRFYKPWQKAVIRILCNYANVIVCNSDNTRRSLLEGLPGIADRGKIHVIYNGVNLDEIRRASLGTRDREPGVFVCCTVARMVPQKSLHTLIEAFAAFHHEVAASRLVIVGDGPLREELMRLVRQLDIEDHVIFAGEVPRKVVYELLSNSDLFIMASRWEGFCNAMVEAMAAGIPVIASNIETLREVLGNDNGFFFEVGSASSLKMKMDEAYHSVALREVYSRRARSRADDALSLEASVSKYKDLYAATAKFANI
jgi:glycosyltransferase involved in cell wall biosynthesis